MPTPPSAESLLLDIVTRGERIERYVDATDFDAFAADTMIQDAVIRCLEVTGEASARLLSHHPAIQEQYPQFQLRQAYRARNRTARGYGTVNLETIWRTATAAAPQLAAMARKILDERRSPQ